MEEKINKLWLRNDIDDYLYGLSFTMCLPGDYTSWARSHLIITTYSYDGDKEEVRTYQTYPSWVRLFRFKDLKKSDFETYYRADCRTKKNFIAVNKKEGRYIDPREIVSVIRFSPERI